MCHHFNVINILVVCSTQMVYMYLWPKRYIYTCQSNTFCTKIVHCLQLHLKFSISPAMLLLDLLSCTASAIPYASVFLWSACVSPETSLTYYSIHMCLEIINYTNMMEVQSNCALVVEKVSYSTIFLTMMYTVHGALVASDSFSMLLLL